MCFNQVGSNKGRPMLKQKKCLAAVVIKASLISETDTECGAGYRFALIKVQAFLSPAIY